MAPCQFHFIYRFFFSRHTLTHRVSQIDGHVWSVRMPPDAQLLSYIYYNHPEAISEIKFAQLSLTLLFRSRRDGRSANGTLTLRRSSTTPIGQASQSAPSTDHAVQQSIPVDTTPVLPSNYDAGPARYTKDDLLGLYRSQKPGDDPTRLFIPGWDPTHVNGGNVRGWGKTNDSNVPQEPGACWDHDGHTAPMGLHEFSTDEKEVGFPTEAIACVLCCLTAD